MLLQSIVDQKAAIVSSFSESRAGTSLSSRESAAEFLLEKIKNETLTIASRLNESKSTVDSFHFKQWSDAVLAASTVDAFKSVVEEQ